MQNYKSRNCVSSNCLNFVKKILIAKYFQMINRIIRTKYFRDFSNKNKSFSSGISNWFWAISLWWKIVFFSGLQLFLLRFLSGFGFFWIAMLPSLCFLIQFDNFCLENFYRGFPSTTFHNHCHNCVEQKLLFDAIFWKSVNHKN